MPNTFFNTIGGLMRHLEERMSNWHALPGMDNEASHAYLTEYVGEMVDDLFAPDDRETYSQLYSDMVAYLLAYPNSTVNAE